jgi:hypothetical protein
MKNPVITLTTDFGTNDSYVAIVKGVILGINPEVKIIDITHSIEPQNIAQAAFLLNVSYRYFPKQTVHMAIVDPGVGGERQGVILKTPSAFFVAPDNGILSYIINETCRVEGPLTQYSQSLERVELKRGLEAVAITDPRFWRRPVSPTFHGRDIFAPVAAGLSLGISLYEFGEKISSIHVFPVPRPFFDLQGNLIGHILYVDHFGNLITDIRNTDLPHTNVTIEVAGQYIQGISRYYEQEEEFVALLGSSGYLEISLRNGNASDFLGMIVGDEIKVIPAKEE